jgi:PAS domain S-box-containing protein
MRLWSSALGLTNTRIQSGYTNNSSRFCLFTGGAVSALPNTRVANLIVAYASKPLITGDNMLPRLLKPSERDPLNSPQEQASTRYQALRDSDSTGVYTCDSSGVITYYNNQAAELWGRKPALGDTDEKFCGSHMMYRVDGSFLPHDQCPMADVLSGKVSGVHDGEVHVQRPDGSRVIVIVNIAPLIDDNGVIVGAVNSFCENPLRKPVSYARK